MTRLLLLPSMISVLHGLLSLTCEHLMHQTSEADQILLNPGLGTGAHSLEVSELGEAGGDKEHRVRGHEAVRVAQGVKEHKGVRHLKQNLRSLSHTRSVALQ